MHWDEALENLKQKLENKSLSAQKNYYDYASNFRVWVGKPLPKVTPEDCQAFADEAVTPASQNLRAIALSFFFNRVLNDHIYLKKEVRAPLDVSRINLTRKRINAMIRRTPYPYQAVACLLYGCGLKTGECLGLKRKDITKEYVKVQGRKIPTPKSYWSYIENHLKQHDDARVFVSKQYGSDGKPLPLSMPTINKVLDIKPQLLRHQFAKDHVKHGATLTDIQYLMGLRSAETALRYFKGKPKQSKLPSPADL